MKLDHDLVRCVLLAIEESENIVGINENELLDYLKKHGSYNDRNSIAYTVSKLKEANFITGNVQWANDSPALIMAGNLTYEGHKFLDNIRDDKVWKDTKTILSRFSSVSLSFVSSVASNVISQLIQKQLGFN
ncbi:DUF2513 domain-containing protein [Ligilactobacillus ruminis]|uniref:DUF2513 domain-containing protein n=1 Tax=Ligilactobacillus ruminis TaxID=1623 RepID=UPI001081978C|nr:DUF2513 domain-containing protein [Ligilactobacillus ruminis]TGJ61216.1 DUF2513 domain-containing protein [Ligilactobacillus ruminis]